MATPQNVMIDLDSVEQIRSKQCGGGWSPIQSTVTGRVLMGVGITCLIGGILTGVIVPIRSAAAKTASENIQTTASTSTALITTTMIATTTVATTTITTSATFSYRGIYVNGFASILGDINKENLLLNWSVTNNFNAFSLYDLNTIMGSSQNIANLARFISKARGTYGIKQIADVRSSASQFIDNANYDYSRTNLQERFTVYNLENQWWSSGPSCVFTYYTTILQTMSPLAKNTVPPIIAKTYICFFNNPTRQEVAQATILESLLDRILVHDYRTSPSYNYLQPRLSNLAEAANNQNRTIDIIIIFSAEFMFMYDYFNIYVNNHSFQDAYQNVLNQFNANSFPYKANIRLIGYQIYAYNWSIAARPP